MSFTRIRKSNFNAMPAVYLRTLEGVEMWTESSRSDTAGMHRYNLKEAEKLSFIRITEKSVGFCGEYYEFKIELLSSSVRLFINN